MCMDCGMSINVCGGNDFQGKHAWHVCNIIVITVFLLVAK